jgi:DNA-3-methyladenine glycosylase
LPDRIPRSFYERPTSEVARDLLGRELVHDTPEGRASGTVVECEAYLGSGDPGSHASRRKTPRNAVMFGDAGIAYVYFTYGMHYCFNAVAKPVGEAGAVLIRAIEPREGMDLMQRRRGRRDPRELTTGPAKLTQALGIDGRSNGVDLTSSDLYFTVGVGPGPIVVTGRIGLSAGQDMPLRYCIPGSRFLSKPLR